MFKKSPQCKICQSAIRDKIDKMILAQEVSSAEIIKFAKKHGLLINRSNVCTHKKRHLNPAIIDPVEAKAKKQYDKEQSKMISNQEFLELIKSRVTTEIKNKTLTPSIAEGLKAAELLIKLNEGDPVKDAMLEFIQSISIKND